MDQHMTDTQQQPPAGASGFYVYRRYIPWYASDGRHTLPLGRNVAHDSRNLAFAYRRKAPALVSVLHDRRIPILDQGEVGSCTGNGEVGVLGTVPNYAAVPTGVNLNEAEALRIYSGAETIDGDGPYPPQDNGSSGPSAAKAAMQLGLISGYTHILSLDDLLDALQTQAVSIGINWYDSFDNPPSSGLLSISKGAEVRGGHEPMLRGIDVDAQTVFGDNSWGTSWGPLQGSFTIGWDTMERLLAEDGDATVSVPLSQPAPVPTPTPVPVPTPTPADPDAALWAATRPWAHGRHTGANERAAHAVLSWGAVKGYQ
jgi:hypothetical protein